VAGLQRRMVPVKVKEIVELRDNRRKGNDAKIFTSANGDGDWV